MCALAVFAFSGSLDTDNTSKNQTISFFHHALIFLSNLIEITIKHDQTSEDEGEQRFSVAGVERPTVFPVVILPEHTQTCKRKTDTKRTEMRIHAQTRAHTCVAPSARVRRS